MVTAADASGGRYSANSAAWNPLFSLPVPPGNSATLTVWARHRGVPVQLKSIDTEGRQTEHVWAFVRPEKWTWSELGTYPRSALQSRIIVIRGNGDAPDAGLDAVFLADNPSARPTDFLARGQADAANAVVQPTTPAPTEELATARVDLAIDWAAPTYPTTRRQFSLAGFSAFSPEIAGDSRYHEFLAYTAIGNLRYHNMAVLRDSKTSMGWIDVANRRWDAAKINAALAALPAARLGLERVICIPEWPEWMDADHDAALDPDQIDAFAAWCAELVRIVNIEGRHGVTHWEITNERDLVYWLTKDKSAPSPRRHAELANIIIRAAKAMKAVDPTIKTGGPSATRSDLTEELRLFVRHAAPQLDFLSFHAYASGRLDEPDASIMGKTDTIGGHLERIVKMLAEELPGREIETHFNEYNISWTWKTREPRMLDHRGAVFDALVLLQIARTGVTVGNAWNERDGVYGKISNDWTLRPSAHVYHHFNTLLTGRAVSTVSSDPRRVAALAVHGASGPALVLINRTANPQMAALSQSGAPALPSAPRLARIDADGHTRLELPARSLEALLALPPHSVTFLH
jgi:hypothetical protein